MIHDDSPLRTSGCITNETVFRFVGGVPRVIYFAILDYADLLIRANGERVVDEKFLRSYVASLALYHWAHIPMKLDLSQVKDELNVTGDIVSAISEAIFTIVNSANPSLVPHLEEVSGMIIPVFVEKVLSKNPAVLSKVRRSYNPETHVEKVLKSYYLYLDKSCYKNVDLHENIVYKCKKPGSIKNQQYFEKVDRYDCYLPPNIYKCIPIEFTDQVASSAILKAIVIPSKEGSDESVDNA